MTSRQDVAVINSMLRDRLARVSRRWRDALQRESSASTVTDRRSAIAQVRPDLALGVASIHEGYALHTGQDGILTAETPESLSLLIGDHLYAAGLCDIAATGDLDAVRTLAALIADTAALADPDDRAAAAPEREALWDAALSRLH